MMRTSLLRSLIGPIIAMLGSIVIVIGFFLPMYFTFPPMNLNDTNPYPPVMNGWQIISLPSFARSFDHSFFVLALFMAALILCTSLLILFQKGSLLVSRICLLASFVCSTMFIYFCVFYIFLMNLSDSPDGAAASPTFASGPGCKVLLLGMALSAIGMALSALGGRSISIGALIGAFIGTVVGMFIGFSLSFIPWGLIPGNIRDFFLSMLGPIDSYLGSMLLGSILGGWVFLKVNRFFKDIDSDLETF